VRADEVGYSFEQRDGDLMVTSAAAELQQPDGRFRHQWLAAPVGGKLAAAHALFGRYEQIGKDEPSSRASRCTARRSRSRSFKWLIYDFLHIDGLSLGLGGLVSTYSYAAALNSAYGARPTSFMVFARARL
jgi:hypothetical protein